MIYTIPMLISKNVDSHVIPGICKAYERFFIVFRMNEIRRQLDIERSRSRRGLSLVDNFDVRDKDVVETYLSELNTPPGGNPGNKPHTQTDTEEHGIQLDTRSMGEYLSIEPTWITVTTTNEVDGVRETIPTLIGVKVLPVMLRDEDYAFEKLTSDRYSGFWKTFGKRLYRSTMRTVLHYVYAAWPIPFFGPSRSSATSGSVKDDLFFNKSSYHVDNRIICCLDYNEVPTDFFSNPKKINRMYSLFWNAFFMTDNINRRVFFAAPEYRGQASILPYSYLNTLTRQTSDAFKDQETNQLKSSPLFHMKKIDMSKLAESISHERGDLISEKKELLIEETEAINLDKNSMKSFIKKHGIRKIAMSISNFNKAVKMKNPELMRKSLSIFPEASVSSIEMYMKKSLGPKFNILYEYAQKVLKNSADIPEKYLKLTSLLLVASCGNSMKVLQELLKKFVLQYRERSKKVKANPDKYGFNFDEFIAHIIIITFLFIITSVAGSVITIFYAMFNSIEGFYSGVASNPQSAEYFKATKQMLMTEIRFDTSFKGVELPPMEEFVPHQSNKLEMILDRVKNMFIKTPEDMDHNWFFSLLTKLGIDEKTLNEFNATAYFTMGMVVCFIFITILQNSVRKVVDFSRPVVRR
jgi:hypothetical protein